jgi:two-component system cell cycle response regulator DivK
MSKRILVVEDHADNRQIIRDMLAPTDYEITETESGEEAIAAIAKQRPDLILMDIQLPTMDGYTATSRINDSIDDGKGPSLSLTALWPGQGEIALGGAEDIAVKARDPLPSA